MFVLDEADEMLSRGFKDQIYEIFQKLGPNTQVRPKMAAGADQLVNRAKVPSPPSPAVLLED